MLNLSEGRKPRRSFGREFLVVHATLELSNIRHGVGIPYVVDVRHGRAANEFAINLISEDIINEDIEKIFNCVYRGYIYSRNDRVHDRALGGGCVDARRSRADRIGSLDSPRVRIHVL